MEAKREKGGKLFTVFVDYSKAFDLLDRSIIIRKLKGLIAQDNPIALTIQNILADNYVTIKDNDTTSEEIAQWNGVLQGDPLSPLLFNVAMWDVVNAIKKNDQNVKVYLYADDMVIASKHRDDLQEALDKLTAWAIQNGLYINKTKTTAMIFRNGGKLGNHEKDIFCAGERLEIQSAYKYLGITLQTLGVTFTTHLKERRTQALLAMNDIKNLPCLSLETAMKLFRLKITPIVTYGLALIWDHLTERNMEDIEKVKASFLKKALCVSRNTLSRLVYAIAKETFFLEDLRYDLQLPSTTAWNSVIQRRREKMAEIEEDFYASDAFLNRDWTGTNYELRHVVTRLSIHGFHHKICSLKLFHSATSECVCELCGRECGKYHIQWCKERTKSITSYSKET